MVHDIGGPLCFSGDIVVGGVALPRLAVGDIVVLEEAGGNTLGMATSHCSRRRPPVYGYRCHRRREGQQGEAGHGSSEVKNVPSCLLI